MCKTGPSCDLIPSTQSPIYSITGWKENERPRNLTSPNFLEFTFITKRVPWLYSARDYLEIKKRICLFKSLTHSPPVLADFPNLWPGLSPGIWLRAGEKLIFLKSLIQKRCWVICIQK